MNGKGLLDGVKVLDLTRVLAGPYCGMMLADMGAEVIKIEMPGKGDDARRNAPIVNGESAYYMNLNRNKKGMTLNLKSERGREIFRELVRQSDIVLENYRPGVMEKLGLGYEDLRKINPAIVYGAVSGFGHYGPYSSRPGYDILGQAMSGLMSTTGWPGGQPTRTGTAISDVMGGISCCVGVLAAYVNRLKTGEGDKVDVSLVDSMVSSLEIINMIYLCTGRVPTPIGNRYEAIYPYDSFEAVDGMVIIACGNDKLYEFLKTVLNISELEEERFSSNVKRVENHEPLKAIIEQWTRTRKIDDIVDILLKAGIPSAPINTIDRVAKDPHIAGAREMFVDLEHPVAGKMKVTGNQLKFTNKKIEISRPAPLLGQHTEEILTEKLGMSHDDYEELMDEKAI
ncbi:CaiB/BaiF CoA-transferase family protein [Faecalicatena orotica]|uniref:Formyl-CoA transferase n=1 Tax=Faecalicatena orotica TaxID=1544 RepID=A0A2Y9BM14_9FIRM|nr:CoA transferase [Faecalicatena orotica]PWJ22843.1 formyl-CoA transferase [Faecalicatena orotica]SSA57978.1 formyl-CoA transferase [Faecalicatena orotica]